MQRGQVTVSARTAAWLLCVSAFAIFTLHGASDAATPTPADGGRSYGFIGVGMAPVTPEEAKLLGLPPGQTTGVIVRNVIPGAPAEKAGLRTGDVIVTFDGEEVHNPRELLQAVAFRSVGHNYLIEYFRRNPGSATAGDRFRTQIKLAERTDGANVERLLADDLNENLAPVEPVGGDPLAVAGLSIGPAQEGQLREGLRVFSVVPNSDAAMAGFFVGDRIVEIEGRKVNTREEFIQALTAASTATAAAGKPVQVVYFRDGKKRQARWHLSTPLFTPTPTMTSTPAPYMPQRIKQ